MDSPRGNGEIHGRCVAGLILWAVSGVARQIGEPTGGMTRDRFRYCQGRRQISMDEGLGTVRHAACWRSQVPAGSGARAAAQEAAPEPMEYRLYVANESSDIVSRVVFRPGAGAEVEKEIPVGIMPADNDGAHGAHGLAGRGLLVPHHRPRHALRVRVEVRGRGPTRWSRGRSWGSSRPPWASPPTASSWWWPTSTCTATWCPRTCRWSTPPP